MIKIIIAWAVAGVVVFGAYKAYAAFKNPWAMPAVSVPAVALPASPVLGLLPAPGTGCANSKDCFHD